MPSTQLDDFVAETDAPASSAQLTTDQESRPLSADVFHGRRR